MKLIYKSFSEIKNVERMIYFVIFLKINPIALRKAKIVYNFGLSLSAIGLSECNRAKKYTVDRKNTHLEEEGF